MGMAILTENFILLKNSTVRSIIHDGRSYGVLRGAIFHCVLSSVITVAGLAMVHPPAAAFLLLPELVHNAVCNPSLLLSRAGCSCLATSFSR